MLLMIIAVLIIFGLIFGSFINALVWRVHEQAELAEAVASKKKAKSKKVTVTSEQLSIVKGRSMCSHCHHELAPKDLIPLFSWLSLRGKCRYCGVKIQDNPLIEVALPVLFVLTYVFWPVPLQGSAAVAIFVLWLLELVGLVALAVYDLRWMLLPSRIMYPLGILGLVQAIIAIVHAPQPSHALLQIALAVTIGGGLFYLLFQLSQGKWIGGGDVKLGWLLGLTAGTAVQSMLFIFLAAVGGTVVSLPFLVNGKLKKGSVIPFGPLLILGAIVVRLFGMSLWAWYQRQLGLSG